MAAFSGTEIRHATDDQLRECLIYCYILIGLREYPTADEDLVMFDFMRIEYPRFTLQEVKRAFQMLIRRQLEANQEHYGLFSCKYFAEVMNAYREEAIHLRKEIEQKSITEPPKSIENTGPVDWSEDWDKVKQMAREGEINALYITDALYNWIDKQGLITISAKEKWQMIYQAAIIYRMELQHENPLPNADIRTKLDLLDNGKWKDDPDIATRVWIMAKKECVKIEAFKAVKKGEICTIEKSDCEVIEQ